MDEIVVGVDESETARRAAQKAAAIAQAGNAPLHVVICVQEWAEEVRVGGESYRIDSATSAEQYVKKLDLAASPPQVTYTVSHGKPAEALCSAAARVGARMIVVGNRRVQGISRVLGSVANDVLRDAPCDVLVANTTGD